MDGQESPSKVIDVKSPEIYPEPRRRPCSHPSFSKIERMKFRNRIELLKECRRCGHQRVWVTFREFGNGNAFVNSYVYDVPRHRDSIPESGS